MHQDGGLKKLWRLSTREQVLDIMKFMLGYKRGFSLKFQERDLLVKHQRKRKIYFEKG